MISLFSIPPTCRGRAGLGFGGVASRALLIGGIIGLVGISSVCSTPAFAQIAGAVGRALPSGDLPVGTVTVRVLAGDMSKTEIGRAVTATVNGQTRTVSTDDSGRATFSDLPVGAVVALAVQGAEPSATSMAQVTVPAAGGLRLMLSSKPLGGDAPAPDAQPNAPADTSARAPVASGGMPAPRSMSGTPRDEQADPPAQITVRVTYNDLADAQKPEGLVVQLVGYKWDNSISLQTATTDADGRVIFSKLDRTGGTSYFAMALLPRNGGFDRTMSQPIIANAVGQRVMLSGDKRDATAPPVDDLANFLPQPPVAVGHVRVSFVGAPENVGVVQLKDVATGKVIAETNGAATPGAAEPTVAFAADPQVPVRTLDVKAFAIDAGKTSGLAGVTIRLLPAAGGAAAQVAPLEATTAADGSVRISNVGPGAKIATAVVNGKTLTSAPFDVTATGGMLTISQVVAGSEPVVTLAAAAATAGQPVYVETTMHGNLYRSMPFQIVPDRGTSANLFIYPRTLFTFSLGGAPEDRYLGMGGKFEVTNYAWAPYRATEDGLVIPFPKGHVGAEIAEKDKADVTVEREVGVRILRPIPPGGRAFNAAFSLPVKDGAVTWTWALPLGTYQSGMQIKSVGAMRVLPPANVEGGFQKAPQSGVDYYVMPQITLLPNQAFELRIAGLPAVPQWKILAPRVAGVVVLFVLIAGTVLALRRADRARVAADANGAAGASREALLAELATLTWRNENPERQAALRAQLLDQGVPR